MADTDQPNEDMHDMLRKRAEEKVRADEAAEQLRATLARVNEETERQRQQWGGDERPASG